MSSQILPSSFPFHNGHNQTINESVTEATYPNSSATISNFSNTTSTDELMNQEWIKILITVFSASIMIFIIIAAIFGNLLVIISVMRVRKLRYGDKSGPPIQLPWGDVLSAVDKLRHAMKASLKASMLDGITQSWVVPPQPLTVISNPFNS
jgi:hypothetical protein